MPAHCQPYKMSILERLASTVLCMQNDEICIAIGRQEDPSFYIKKSKISVML